MNIKDFIQNIIKEEMQSLKEDEANMKPGGEWNQPGVTSKGLPPDESIRGTTAEIVATILDLFAEYEIGHDGAIEVVHELADELGLVPADEVEPESRPIGFRIDESVIKKLREAKGLATARVAQHGLDTAPSGMDDAHRAVVDAGGYESPGMMRLMRTIAQAARGMNLSPQETLELAQSMLDADMLKTAENDPTGSLEEDATRDKDGRLKSASKQGPGIPSEPTNPRKLTPAEQLSDLRRQLQNAKYIPDSAGRIESQIKDLLDAHPELNESGPRVPEPGSAGGDFRSPTQNALQGQELRDALHSDISDMFKDMNGIRPRWINFQAMSMEELENLHHLTNQQHRDWHNQERVEDDLDDINYEKELRNAMQHDADVENARIDAIEAETERMREPEEGEEFAKHGGMGRGPREAKSWSSYGNAKTLFEGWRKFTKE